MFGNQENCSNVNYQRKHDFGEVSAYEERGMLVITHGKRVGRTYAVEKSWTEKTCTHCGYVCRETTTHQAHEWPGTV